MTGSYALWLAIPEASRESYHLLPAEDWAFKHLDYMPAPWLLGAGWTAGCWVVLPLLLSTPLLIRIYTKNLGCSREVFKIRGIGFDVPLFTKYAQWKMMQVDSNFPPAPRPDPNIRPPKVHLQTSDIFKSSF